MQNSKMLTKEDIKVIGVTGGTGSGKSTVAQILEDYGGVVIDADAISKELMEQGGSAYDAVVGAFGSEILQPDGEIDRKALGERVFGNPAELAKLSALTHGLIGVEMTRRVDAIKEDMMKTPLSKGELRFVVLDVPVPVEEGFFDIANTVWAVVANNDIRIERIMERTGMSEEAAERRVNAQMSNREYMELADITIENEADIDELRNFVAQELVHYFDISTEGYGEQ